MKRFTSDTGNRRLPPSSEAWQARLLEKYYYSRSGWANGTQQFHELVEKYAGRGSRILEIGAGPTNKTQSSFPHSGRLPDWISMKP